MAQEKNENEELSRAVARIHSNVLAFIFALIFGSGLFLMTAWLLVKGGENVGEHLQLLNQYLIGYSVTWTGSIVGFFYGGVIGGVIGWLIGRIYNVVVSYRYRSS